MFIGKMVVVVTIHLPMMSLHQLCFRHSRYLDRLVFYKATERAQSSKTLCMSLYHHKCREAVHKFCWIFYAEHLSCTEKSIPFSRKDLYPQSVQVLNVRHIGSRKQ